MPRIVVQNWRKLWFPVHVWFGLSTVPVAAVGGRLTVLLDDLRPTWQLSGLRTGALSLVFPVTGAMMWLRSRRSRKSSDRASGDATMVAAQ